MAPGAVEWIRTGAQPSRGGHPQDRIHIVVGPFGWLRSCHDHRYDPIPQTDYYRLRAVFEPAYNWKQWRKPSERLISLYTNADRAKAASVEEEASKLANEKQAKQTEFIEAALKKHLEKFEPALREPLWTAFKTAPDKRTAEQKKLLADNPSANITPGVLYQYNPKAADELKAMDAKDRRNSRPQAGRRFS
jgi:hypothetical protein